MWGIVVVLGGGNRSSLLEIELLVMGGLFTLKMGLVSSSKLYLRQGGLSRHHQSC